MSFQIKDAYAKVYRVEDKGNYCAGSLNTYRKDKQKDEYINSWWNCKFVGKAKSVAEGLQDKTKVKIVSAIVENKSYEKDGQKRSWLEVVVFDMEVDGQAQTDGFYPVRDNEEDSLPF